MGSLTSAAVLDSTTVQSPILLGRHQKTIDIGLDGSTASLGPTGDILQLSCFHPKHGIVVAVPFRQFDGQKFHDPLYVRTYRILLLDLVRSSGRGFGVQLEGTVSDLNIAFINNQWPRFTYKIGDFDVDTTLWITRNGEAIQSTKVTCTSTTAKTLAYSLSINLSVNRASYGQLTEGGPIPIPPSQNVLKLTNDGERFLVSNPNLGATVVGSLYRNGLPVQLGATLKETVRDDEPLQSSFQDTVALGPGESCTLASTFRLLPELLQASDLAKPSVTLAVPSSLRGHWKLPDDEASMIIKRNLEYVIGNCAAPVGNDDNFICLVADHVALPLGWNRDNYWQVRYLLDLNQKLDLVAFPETANEYHQEIRKTVRGHLNWVFTLAQRPHGYWHRSYLATGVPKDGPVFQQDQQCYPILELCEFLETFPAEEDFVRGLLDDGTVASILEMILGRRAAQSGLFPTEETPGDDEVEYPFHFSTHVLLWHTVTKLSRTVEKLGNISTLSVSKLNSLATEIHDSTLEYFVGKHPITGKTMFAYLTDGNGLYTFYHDANDIPTLFAKDWGFIRDAEEGDIWAETMEFGISTENKEGHYPQGQFGGLGSVHTRGPWPLGYAQEYVYASMKGDKLAKEDAWRRIKGAVFWDGLFSEAVDPDTGDCISKAWFSWPGAMIGSALLHFDIAGLLAKSVL